MTLAGNNPSPPRPLAGVSAVVTGASRGIGEAVALRLSQSGARCALVARSPDLLDSLARRIGGVALPTDLRDADAVLALPARLREALGPEASPVSLLVTAAGVFDLGPADELDPEVLDRNLEVNLRAGLLTMRAFLPAMLEQGRGTIIQVGSVAGRRAFPGNLAYSASKYGLRGAHEVLLEELRGTGVRATLLEPAATNTSIWDPMNPDANPSLPDRSHMLAPSEVAEAVAFVATRAEGVQIPFFPIERI